MELLEVRDPVSTRATARTRSSYIVALTGHSAFWVIVRHAIVLGVVLAF